MTATISQWLAQASACIDSDNPRLDAEYLLAERWGKNRAYLLAFADEKIPTDLLAQLTTDVNQLARGCPLAYVLGKKAFWDMELRVTEATLIPRADTETLVELASKLLPKDTRAKLIDLGTGSGAIAIALSRLFPRAEITATDLSSAALTVAQQNANDWQIAPIHFVNTSWLTGFEPETFDMIVSNPPYIPQGDGHLDKLSYEPMGALTASKRGMADIETIIQQSQRCLKAGGWLLLEHGYDQGEAVRRCFEESHWQSIMTYRDLGGNERVTAAQYDAPRSHLQA